MLLKQLTRKYMIFVFRYLVCFQFNFYNYIIYERSIYHLCLGIVIFALGLVVSSKTGHLQTFHLLIFLEEIPS